MNTGPLVPHTYEEHPPLQMGLRHDTKLQGVRLIRSGGRHGVQYGIS